MKTLKKKLAELLLTFNLWIEIKEMSPSPKQKFDRLRGASDPQGKALWSYEIMEL